MKRMTRKNLRNIQHRFQEKTGVTVPADQRKPVLSSKKVWILVTAIIVCFAMAAFTYPLFSSLDGDELSFSATYESNGVVSVHVENRSDKTLKFQEQTKLIRWVTAEEMPRLGGKPVFENTEFAPHSAGRMTIDLSAAYDMQAIEESFHRDEWFYLLLTNNNFLFGQDWICSR